MQNSTVRLLIIFLILSFTPLLPADARQGYPQLLRCNDRNLQQGLEVSLRHIGLADAVKRKSLSVALVDVTDPFAPRLASVNGDEMIYAASLPKIAVLLGAFERINRGEMNFDAATCDTLTCMIRNSSNRAATEMLNRVGKEFLADLLQSPTYKLYDPAVNGGLWVGKEYGKGSAWKRDPLHHISHGATALQVARFYYLLQTGRLVSPEVSLEMKEILGHSAIHHNFVKGLEKARPGSKIYRKSGTWRQYHADSAIVERDGHSYIAVALAEDAHGGEWLSRLIVALDDLIFSCGTSPHVPLPDASSL